MYTFTRRGSIALAKIISSCHLSGLKEKELELVKKGFAGKNLRQSDFEKAEKKRMRKRLIEFCKNMGKRDITEEMVFKYFGSRQHERKIYSDIVAQRLSYSLEVWMLAIHLVIPVKIIKSYKRKLFDLQYKNNGKKVIFRNAIAFKDFGKQVRVGSSVLFHYSSIVSSFVPLELKSYLLKEQLGIKRFMEAIVHFNNKEIDLTVVSKRINNNIIEKHDL